MAPAIPGVAEDADAVMQGVSGPITVSLDAMKIEVRKIWENIVQIDHLGGVIGLIILCACVMMCCQTWQERHETHKFTRLEESRSAKDASSTTRHKSRAGRSSSEKRHSRDAPDLAAHEHQQAPPPFGQLPMATIPPRQHGQDQARSDQSTLQRASSNDQSNQQQRLIGVAPPPKSGIAQNGSSEAVPVLATHTIEEEEGEGESDYSEYSESESFYSDEWSSYDEDGMPYARRAPARKAIRSADRTDTRPGHAEKVWTPVKPKVFLKKVEKDAARLGTVKSMLQKGMAAGSEPVPGTDAGATSTSAAGPPGPLCAATSSAAATPNPSPGPIRPGASPSPQVATAGDASQGAVPPASPMVAPSPTSTPQPAKGSADAAAAASKPPISQPSSASDEVASPAKARKASPKGPAASKGKH